ncbi:MAG: hypothetical protein MUO77_05185 [Anaerolineales bacterium]|nr:hypothetical protein [Anaerolineales bacterium]
MNYNDQPIIPTESEPGSTQNRAQASRVRRRRVRHLEVPKDAEGQSALIASLARRAYPSYELFIYALLCGAVLGLGFLLDSQAILLFGILLAPLMTPWVGMLLAIVTGSIKFFFETLAALLISAALIFISTLLAGFASRIFLPLTFNNAFIHSHLWVPELVILTFGAILLTASFIRSEERPFLPSVLVAYAFFLPLSAGAFGLGANEPGIWPAGILVSLVHLGWATVFGLLTLFVLRFKPSMGGLVFSILLGLAIIVAVWIALTGSAPTSANETIILEPTQTLDLTPTVELAATQMASSTPLPLSDMPGVETATPPSAVIPVPLTLAFLPATQTPTITLTIEPTPVYAKINANEGGGANLRKAPNGKFLAVLENGTLVEVLSDIQEITGVTWAHVVATKNGIRIEGWILQSVLVTATPVVNWQPSVTVTNTGNAIATETSIVTPVIDVTPVP